MTSWPITGKCTGEGISFRKKGHVLIHDAAMITLSTPAPIAQPQAEIIMHIIFQQRITEALSLGEKMFC